MRRWLISVEPDPENAVPSTPDEAPPEVNEVVSKALFGIPRYQSVAADMERLQQHRDAVDGARQVLRGVDDRAAERLRNAEDEADALSELRAQQLTATGYEGQRSLRFADQCTDPGLCILRHGIAWIARR